MYVLSQNVTIWLGLGTCDIKKLNYSIILLAFIQQGLNTCVYSTAVNGKWARHTGQ